MKPAGFTVDTFKQKAGATPAIACAPLHTHNTLCSPCGLYLRPCCLATGAQSAKVSSYEYFHAHDDIVTCAVFAPSLAWRQNARTDASSALVPRVRH